MGFCPSVTSCYSFVISDTYGDGICCSYGNGSYSVTYNGTVTVEDRLLHLKQQHLLEVVFR